jgi:ElaB/YqjD/DUF883 family membrane-anchored ribosome-binding protein
MEEFKKNAEKKVNEGTDKLREGLEKARNQTIQTIEKEIGDSEESLENAKERGREVWENAKARGQELWGDVSFKTEEILSNAQSFVRRRPAQAIGISILVGLVLGALIVPKGGSSKGHA